MEKAHNQAYIPLELKIFLSFYHITPAWYNHKSSS